MNRATLAAAALDLIARDGLDALTMRTLAAATGVKAPSLYWHVRDRDELLDLTADALLARVALPARSREWRDAARRICEAIGEAVGGQRDGARIVGAVPGALRRSAAFGRLEQVIESTGVEAAIAAELAAMALGFAATRNAAVPGAAAPRSGRPLTLAIDSGSRGVVVRAGGPLDGLVRVSHDRGAAAPAVVRKERVIVRRLRGGKGGELEISTAHPWRVQVQGPTWNTVLDLTGIDLRELKLDSGASGVECLLPPPRGVVPLRISSGVVRVRLRRAPATAVHAEVKSGAVQVALDDFRPRVTTRDTHWETPAARTHPDRYELEISSGAVRISLDETAPDLSDLPPAKPRPSAGAAAAALEILCDGIAAAQAARGR